MQSAYRCFVSYALPLLLLAGVAMGIPDQGLPALLDRYKAEPNNSLVCEQIGVAYTQTGNLEQAAQFLTKAVQLDPERVSSSKNLATVLWFLNRKTDSEAMFLELQKRIPDDPVPHLYLGLGAYNRKDLEGAALNFSRSGELASDNPETRLIVIETYLSTGRFAAARTVLEKGLEQKPDSATLLFELGLAHALDGHFDEGRQTFLQASTADPRWPLPLMALGIVTLQAGDANDAAAYFRRARTLAPQDYRCYYFHAIALKHSQLNGDAATRAAQLKDLQRAAALDPNEENVWAALGEIEIASGRAVQGAADLRHALRLAPDNPGALYKLGLLYRREGRTRESERLMHQFQESRKKLQADENELVSLLRTANQ